MISDEQAREIWGVAVSAHDTHIRSGCGGTKAGRAAFAAACEIALAPVANGEVASVANNWTIRGVSQDVIANAAGAIIANRYRTLLLKPEPDAAVDAVAGLLHTQLAHMFTTDLKRDSIEKIVAAVRAADAKAAQQ